MTEDQRVRAAALYRALENAVVSKNVIERLKKHNQMNASSALGASQNHLTSGGVNAAASSASAVVSGATITGSLPVWAAGAILPQTLAGTYYVGSDTGEFSFDVNESGMIVMNRGRNLYGGPAQVIPICPIDDGQKLLKELAGVLLRAKNEAAGGQE